MTYLHTAHSIFHDEFGASTNFVTPNVLQMGMIGHANTAFEISSGTWKNKPMIAVTFAWRNANGSTDRDVRGWSRSFWYDDDTDSIPASRAYAHARRYILRLQASR